MTDGADQTIAELLQSQPPQSFFLYAGAGSGKTSSLIRALSAAKDSIGGRYRARGSSIAVITYTNAASNEIKERLGFDPIADVSTIHSFAWQQIADFTKDIAAWLKIDLESRLDVLLDQERRGRPNTKASTDRLRRIARAERRLDGLTQVRRFAYSPDQTRSSGIGLSHSEVLGLFAHFVQEKPLFQQILIGRHPMIFIDEVQDTNKHVIRALLKLQEAHADNFALGLFGDTMQRIYLDGDPELESLVPAEWARPHKTVNYRSSKRVVKLINDVRSRVDDYAQSATAEAPEGMVQVFVLSDSLTGKLEAEAEVRTEMSRRTGDPAWNADEDQVKTLILEHSMAAKRFGFENFLRQFSSETELRTRMINGQSGVTGVASYLGSQVLPLATSIRANDLRAADRVLRRSSPLMDRSQTKADFEAARARAQEIRRTTLALADLWSDDGDPSLRAVASLIQESGILAVPDLLGDVLALDTATAAKEDDDDPLEPEAAAWLGALDVSFGEFARYYAYVTGNSPFDTHQGVKGLEFDRVLVVLDDSAAGGNLFNYIKLLNGSESSAGRSTVEDTVSRTRRLFYVACSRARTSLAVVLYAQDIVEASRQLASTGWFEPTEIESAIPH